MFELPIFPLNTVLFPGFPLQLHVFEERYKLLVSRCLEKDRSFGVALIRSGKEALGPLPEPHAIGCVARIMEIQPLDGGKMNVLTMGQERFRILSLDYSQPYLVGQVDSYPITRMNETALVPIGNELRKLVEGYVRVLSESRHIETDTRHLPADPVGLAYLGAGMLQISIAQKQVLLATEMAYDLIAMTVGLFRREIALLQAITHHSESREVGPFSIN